VSIHDAADKLGVRCIGLGQMILELGIDEGIKDDCDKFESRFPDGEPATYKDQPVLVRRMIFDRGNFPFYRVVFELDREKFIVGGSEIGSTFRWN